MIKLFLIIGFILQTIFVVLMDININKLEKNNSNLQIEIDSLKNEVFIHHTNETRYEIARNNLIIEHKECGEKFDEMLSQTE